MRVVQRLDVLGLDDFREHGVRLQQGALQQYRHAAGAVRLAQLGQHFIACFAQARLDGADVFGDHALGQGLPQILGKTDAVLVRPGLRRDVW